MHCRLTHPVFDLTRAPGGPAPKFGIEKQSGPDRLPQRRQVLTEWPHPRLPSSPRRLFSKLLTEILMLTNRYSRRTPASSAERRSPFCATEKTRRTPCRTAFAEHSRIFNLFKAGLRSPLG